jgi:DNA-binding NarL/FixJ family response regulator
MPINPLGHTSIWTPVRCPILTCVRHSTAIHSHGFRPQSSPAGAHMVGEKPSVFLIAGNRLLREALAKLLAKRGGFYLCGASPYKLDIGSSVGASGTDILILDSATAHLCDCSLVTSVLNQVSDIKVALIDMENDPEMFLECVRAGAVGYFLKDASAAEVVAGVQAIARGQAVCPPQLSLVLFRAFSRQWSALPNARVKLELGLTRRQQQLIPMIAKGLTNKEIAAQLNLSEGTVKNHIHDILRRIGVGDRLQVVDKTRLWERLA